MLFRSASIEHPHAELVEHGGVMRGLARQSRQQLVGFGGAACGALGLRGLQEANDRRLVQLRGYRGVHNGVPGFPGGFAPIVLPWVAAGMCPERRGGVDARGDTGLHTWVLHHASTPREIPVLNANASTDLQLVRASLLLETDPAAAARSAREMLASSPGHSQASLLLAAAYRRLEIGRASCRERV